MFVRTLTIALLAGVMCGCKSAAKVKLSDLVLVGAEQLELKPFSPTGGYEVGSFIYIDERGYPVEVASPDWVREHLHKDKDLKSEQMPPWRADMSSNFKLVLESATQAGEGSADVLNELKRISNVSLIVDESTRTFLAEGEIEVTYWKNTLGPRLATDNSLQVSLRSLLEHEPGSPKFVVVETVTVTKGHFDLSGVQSLSLDAKTTFIRLMSGRSHVAVDATGDVSMTITSDYPLKIGYRSYPIPTDALKQMLAQAR
ncbi:hypothetical protein L0337_43670 [candidate division KSB1 bacterium]|nr:hypothetical protein [candidate division KSB1 bacterium]